MKYIGAITVISLTIAITLSGLHSATTFIHGYVYNASDSTALAYADVDGRCVDVVGTFHTTTNAQGYYNVQQDTLNPYPGGNWRVTASKSGYQSQTKSVQLPNPFTNVNFYLMPNLE